VSVALDTADGSGRIPDVARDAKLYSNAGHRRSCSRLVDVYRGATPSHQDLAIIHRAYQSDSQGAWQTRTLGGRYGDGPGMLASVYQCLLRSGLQWTRQRSGEGVGLSVYPLCLR
jgi:hypothetical protein